MIIYGHRYSKLSILRRVQIQHLPYVSHTRSYLASTSFIFIPRNKSNFNRNKASDPIGAWEMKLENYIIDRPTDRPTNLPTDGRRTDRVIGEFPSKKEKITV